MIMEINKVWCKPLELQWEKFHDYRTETYVLIHFIAESPEKGGVTSTLPLTKTKFNSCSHLL